MKIKLKFYAKIIKDLEFRAMNRGLKYLTLHSSLTAVSFYENNGFKKGYEGTHALARGEQMACVIMKKEIIGCTSH